MCVCLHDFMCTMCVQDPPEGGVALLALELRAVVSCLMEMLGTAQVLYKSSKLYQLSRRSSPSLLS